MPAVADPQLPNTNPPGFDPEEDLLAKGGYSEDENPYYQAPQGPPEGSFAETRQQVRQWRERGQDYLQKRFARKKSAVEAPPIEKPPVIGQEISKTGQNVAGKTAKELEERAANSSLKGVERKALTGAGRKVATQSAEQIGKTVAKGAAKQGGKTLARVGAEAAAGIETVGAGFVLAAVDLTVSAAVYAVKKWWPQILIGIGIILLLPALIFGIKGLGGTNISPSTEIEKAQAVEVAALSGNPTASAEVVFKEAEAVKQSFVTAKAAAAKKYKNNASKLAAATKDADEIITILEQIKNVAGNKPERLKLIEVLKPKRSAFETKYPELVFQAGTCADLKPFIDSKQFVVGSGPNAKLIVRGMMKNIHNGISPASQDLCGALVYALRAGYKIYTGSLSYQHGVCIYNDCVKNAGKISAHACGAAIDIGMINNDSVRLGSEDTKKFLQTLVEGGKAGKIYVQQAISPFRELYIKNNTLKGNYTDSAHDDHIHLSGRPMNPTCMKTGKP